MRPNEVIEPWVRKLDRDRLAQFLYDRHRGRDRRVKVKDIAAAMLGIVPEHGSAAEVAVREVLSDLVDKGLPIASEPGTEGGIWWLASEDERKIALAPLRAQLRALQDRIDSLTHAGLDFRLPKGQPGLFS